MEEDKNEELEKNNEENNQVTSEETKPEEPVTEPKEEKPEEPIAEPKEEKPEEPIAEPKEENKNEVKEEKAKKEVDPAKKKKTTKMIVTALVAIIIIAAIIVYFAVFHKKTIDLSDYINVTYYTETSSSYYYDDEDYENAVAYDGYATARVSLDTSKLKELLGSKKEAEKFIEKTTLTIETDDNGNLSNGDTITIKVKISSSYLKNQKLKLKDETITIEVKGLEEADVLDLFDEDDFEIEVEGISPNLSVSVNNNSSNSFIKKNVNYSLSDYSGLANGDTITITAYYSESAALEEGVIIAEDTYEYTLEGYAEYIEDVDDLTDSILETLKAEFVESVNDEIENEGVSVISYNYDDVSYSDEYTASEPELVSTYFLTKKGTTSSYWSYSYNRVYAIYKVVYTIASTGTTYDWYFVASVSNVAVRDGELYEEDDLTYSVSGRWDDGKTEDEAYNDLIDSNKGSYVIETVD